MTDLRILVLTDAHYSSVDAVSPAHPKRQTGLGAELIKRAIEDARRRDGFDCIAILGDMIDDGMGATARADLQAVAATIRKAAPDSLVLAVPGNHDNRPAFEELFGPAGEMTIAGWTIVAFADSYAEGDVCTRSEDDCSRLAEIASRARGPIVVMQHNPMHPPIDDPYPYMLTNRRQVMADYSRLGVKLSISGHYHRGQLPSVVDGVTYATAPALTESPFTYTLIHLRSNDVQVEFRPLAVAGENLPVTDCHAHTEFAYCGRGISAAMTIDRCRKMGVSGVCLVEHAPQLYCSADDFWAAKHIIDGNVWRREAGRMERFRRDILPLRSADVRVGLEVELDSQGELTLREEDRDWADLLVGAVHFLHPAPAELDDIALAELFMRTNEGLCRSGIDILAHPWRLFQRENRATPEHLYPILADLLAETGVAAEINMHTNYNDPQFIAMCIARGVKIALGSDAHAPWEMGGFSSHLETLRQAAGRHDVGDLLWQPVEIGNW